MSGSTLSLTEDSEKQNDRWTKALALRPERTSENTATPEDVKDTSPSMPLELHKVMFTFPADVLLTSLLNDRQISILSLWLRSVFRRMLTAGTLGSACLTVCWKRVFT